MGITRANTPMTTAFTIRDMRGRAYHTLQTFLTILVFAVFNEPGLCAQKNERALTEEEIQAMPRDEAMRLFLDTYRPALDLVVAEVKTHIPRRYRPIVEGALIRYSVRDAPFAFYTDPRGQNTVYICLGGINALDVSATALGIALRVLKDEGWWFDYLLYHRGLRRKQSNGVWADPLYAGGITRNNISTSVERELVSFAHQSLLDMLSFVLAHEYGHVALKHDGRQRIGEGRAAYMTRIRKNEEDADIFALETIGPMGVNPFAVTFTLLTHLIVFEDSASANGATHPTDGRRITRVIDYYAKKDTEESRAFVESARKMESSLAAYDFFDDDAKTISLESLKVWPPQ